VSVCRLGEQVDYNDQQCKWIIS